jgi:hypothetical protein
VEHPDEPLALRVAEAGGVEGEGPQQRVDVVGDRAVIDQAIDGRGRAEPSVLGQLGRAGGETGPAQQVRNAGRLVELLGRFRARRGQKRRAEGGTSLRRAGRDRPCGRRSHG